MPCMILQTGMNFRACPHPPFYQIKPYPKVCAPMNRVNDADKPVRTQKKLTSLHIHQHNRDKFRLFLPNS